MAGGSKVGKRGGRGGGGGRQGGGGASPQAQDGSRSSINSSNKTSTKLSGAAAPASTTSNTSSSSSSSRGEQTGSRATTTTSSKGGAGVNWFMVVLIAAALAVSSVYFYSQTRRLEEEWRLNEEAEQQLQQQQETHKQKHQEQQPSINSKEEGGGGGGGGKRGKSPEEELSERLMAMPWADLLQHSIAELESAVIKNKDHVYTHSQYAADLASACHLLEGGKHEEALSGFDAILSNKGLPSSPRALLGKAVALDSLAESQKSNVLLDRCLEAYSKVGLYFDEAVISDRNRVAVTVLRIRALERLSDRANFRGKRALAVTAMQKLVELSPGDVQKANRLGVALLLKGDETQAQEVFEGVLRENPDPFAKAHLGYILYSKELYAQAVPLLLEGLHQDPEIKAQGKFYVFAGESLVRLHRGEEAHAIYSQGASRGLFPSVWQRSLHNEPNLRAQPWWNIDRDLSSYASALRQIEAQWKAIKEEGMSVLDLKSGGFLPEAEHLRATGEWGQFTLFARGKKDDKSCKLTPKTCALIEAFPDASGCKRGQVKFSVMQPGTYVWPHTGPTNCRLRLHLGLEIPEGVAIRVATETRTWEEGKFLVFDDSFEHEVWHNGTRSRLVLIMDVWHPDLPPARRKALTPI